MPVFNIEIPESHIPWTYGLRFVGQVMQHSPYVFNIISEVMAHHEVKSIIEIGTGHGGLAMYLGLWGLKLDVPVVTFDIEPALMNRDTRGLLEAMKVKLYNLDVFGDEARDIISKYVSVSPTYLICDGGNKEREFAMYAPMLPVGSVISVHDYGHEVTSIEGIVTQDHPVQLEKFQKHQWEMHDARFATMEKIGDVKEEA